MKKALRNILIFAMMACLFCTYSFAANESDGAEIGNKQELAYMSLEEATPAMRSLILQARNEIIFSKGWSTEGFAVEVVNADGTSEVLPKFSELFPGWDIPVVQATNVDIGQEITSTNEIISQFFTVYLRNPTNQDTSPFTHFYHDGSYIQTMVYSLDPETCNIGYSNYQTGASYGYAAGVNEGQIVRIETAFSGVVGVRASTSNSEGEGTFIVSHDTQDTTIVK